MRAAWNFSLKILTINIMKINALRKSATKTWNCLLPLVAILGMKILFSSCSGDADFYTRHDDIEFIRNQVMLKKWSALEMVSALDTTGKDESWMADYYLLKMDAEYHIWPDSNEIPIFRRAMAMHEKHPGPYKNYIRMLIHSGQFYGFRKLFHKGAQDLVNAMFLAEKIGDDRLLGDVYRGIGSLNIMQDKYRDAIYNDSLALAYYRKSGEIPFIIIGLNNMTHHYTKMDEVSEYLAEERRLAEQLDLPERLAEIDFCTLLYKYYDGESPDSLLAQMQAIYDQMPMVNRQPATSFLATLYIRLGRYDDAKQILWQRLENSVRESDSIGDYRRLRAIYQMQGLLDSALVCADIAQKISTRQYGDFVKSSSQIAFQVYENEQRKKDAQLLLAQRTTLFVAFLLAVSLLSAAIFCTVKYYKKKVRKVKLAAKEELAGLKQNLEQQKALELKDLACSMQQDYQKAVERISSELKEHEDAKLKSLENQIASMQGQIDSRDETIGNLVNRNANLQQAVETVRSLREIESNAMAYVMKTIASRKKIDFDKLIDALKIVFPSFVNHVVLKSQLTQPQMHLLLLARCKMPMKDIADVLSISLSSAYAMRAKVCTILAQRDDLSADDIDDIFISMDKAEQPQQ